MTQPIPPESTTSKDLVHRGISVGVPVSNVEQAMELARVLGHSALVPKDLRGKPADILALMLYGAELGLSAWQSIQGLNPIKGRVTMSAELRVAKTRERGHRVSVVCFECAEYPDDAVHAHGGRQQGGHKFVPDWSQQRCTVKAQRADTGESATVTWTVDDAVAAGLLKRGTGKEEGKLTARSDSNQPLPWELYTRDMLYNRAAARAARFIAPEVAFGVYTPDETEQIIALEEAEAAAAAPVCEVCGKTGHRKDDCPDVVDADVDEAQLLAEMRQAEAEYTGQPEPDGGEPS